MISLGNNHKSKKGLYTKMFITLLFMVTKRTVRYSWKILLTEKYGKMSKESQVKIMFILYAISEL